ncbi:hypothetical protein [uncultured Eubacterium sp.]|uniref:hypothetical protein n=1 Tax=uncultured Eubacterium sp. TaxID=165185 RepID=UPI002598A829|nr:hypothetical protein [uncultured Eubacterium sp.]
MSAIMMKQSLEIADTSVNTEYSLLKRFKAYVLDNSSYLAASAVMMSGSSYGAVQIMRDAKH